MVVTNFVLETTGAEVVDADGVTVITTRLVTTTVLRTIVEFQTPEDAGTVLLDGLVESGMPVDDEMLDPGKVDVGGSSPSNVLLGIG